MLQRHDYFPFGEEYLAQPGTDTRRFTGKDRDAETGLDYFEARYYGSRIGRFTTVDPGHVNGDLFDPQSWNAYAYARNNPLRFVDSSGTEYEVRLGNGTTMYLADDQFGRLRGNPGAGISFDGFWNRGDIWINNGGTKYGSYRYYYGLSDMFRDAGNRAQAQLQVYVREMAINAATTGFFASLRVAGTIPVVANSKLANIVDDLFKGLKGPSVPIGNGTTADAIRLEMRTGRAVFGIFHEGKGRQYAQALRNWLRANPSASRADRAIADGLLRDLEAALKGR